jgi:hypothetical protein
METIVTLYILNGVALTVVRYQELKLLQKWRKGELAYAVLLACKKYNQLNVRKLNPTVKIGKHPGLFKKDD